MNRIARAGIVACLAAIGIATAATGTASADRTGIIYGYSACQDTARSYRNAGYTADCILLQGESYVVDYHLRGESGASPFSAQGLAQLLATGSASASQ
ncbi:hypothetical protein GCM10027262_40540 [Nocardia tengchongensis]